MSNKLLAHARAKVNLSLQVFRKRSDGYHDIETIFQSINLCDRLTIGDLGGSRIEISCTDPSIPSGPKNLCFKAVKELENAAGVRLGARIHIEKNIPSGSGLGGGSSDAAAVLLALNEIKSLGLSPEQLKSAALEIGSDVPFMICGGTKLGRGRGEKLESVRPLKKGFFLVVKPKIDISTSWVYENYNFRLTKHSYRINLTAVNGILARFPEVALTFRNSLEDAVCPAFPEVRRLLEELIATKPCFASMSGSGSALYAIYKNEAEAARLAESFSAEGFFTAVVEPSSKAIDLFPIAGH